VEETTNLIHDNEALTKWKEKVSELGLQGQAQVVTEEKSPIPFLWMNTAIVATFETLCPTKTDIRKYDKTPIPIELLEAVSLCVKEQYFDEIEVWYNDKQKDPVIVGFKYNVPASESDWWRKAKADKYLIGRWADVKASLDALIGRAKKLFFHTETIRLNQELKQKQRELDDLEGSVENKFGGMPATDDLPF
jgi:hypothetical protein